MSHEARRVALVTGATSGIGLAVTRALAAQQHNVFICARSAENVAVTVKELRAEHLEVDGAACDVRSIDDIRAFVRAAVERFGPIDVLVNNAGRSGGGVTADIPDELWFDVVNTNLNSVFRLTREVLNAGGMRDRGRGRIINIASTAGKQGVVLGAPYSASKHGVVGFTKALGNELAPTGITVNAVCPGYTETELLRASLDQITSKTSRSEKEARSILLRNNPQQRFVAPDEVANSALWLCMPGSAAITGQSISVSGGEVT